MKYSIEHDGFYGIKFCPEDNKYPDKIIISFTGSDGNFKLACKMAEYFNGIGITSIAIAYWKFKGLPKKLVKVPLETIENVVPGQTIVQKPVTEEKDYYSVMEFAKKIGLALIVFIATIGVILLLNLFLSMFSRKGSMKYEKGFAV